MQDYNDDDSEHNAHDVRTPSRFHEIEIEKTFDSITSLDGVRAQMIIFFGTATLAILSVALSSEKAALICLAGISVWMCVFYNIFMGKATSRRIYRLYDFRRRFSSDDPAEYLSSVSRSLAEWIMKIESTSSEQERKRIIRNSALNGDNFSQVTLPLIIGLIFIFFGIFAWWNLGWKFF